MDLAIVNGANLDEVWLRNIYGDLVAIITCKSAKDAAVLAETINARGFNAKGADE